MKGAGVRRFLTSSRFAGFARISILVIVLTVIAGGLVPETGQAAEPLAHTRTTGPVQAITTTTFGLPALDLAVATEAVAPSVEEAADTIRREKKVAARKAAEAARWQATLDNDVTDVVLAVASVGEDTADVDVAGSVDALFATAATRSERLGDLLAKVNQQVDALERHIGKAAAAGVATDRYSNVATAAREWHQRQQRAADPYLCSSVLPEEAGEWRAARLGDYEPYLDCLTERITPRIQGVAEAGRALNESLAQLTG